jgi:hypothetical protein
MRVAVVVDGPARFFGWCGEERPPQNLRGWNSAALDGVDLHLKNLPSEISSLYDSLLGITLGINFGTYKFQRVCKAQNHATYPY